MATTKTTDETEQPAVPSTELDAPVTGPAIPVSVMESLTGGWLLGFEVPADRIGPVAYVALADLGAAAETALAVTWLGEAAARLGVYVDSFTEGALVLAVADAPYEPTSVTVLVKL